ncbi:MAG: gamma carbonic anhydrase family protein [Rhodospirillales bacterium]|nr:gamma carbonic anhydrase family protein [Rhodospirillales bacterium]
MTNKPLILPFGGKTPQIADDAFIAPTAVVVGDTIIGSGSSIWFGCVVRGDVHEIRIGRNTNIQDGTIVHVTKGAYGCYIGSDILIGHAAVIHGCTLEDGCFIGMGATVMDGVVVESRAMVAAGALVTPGKTVGSGQLWAGSPARYLRDLSDAELAGFPKAVEGYRAIGQEYREILSNIAE